MFCRYCGREVPEGQSCSCPGAQAARQAQQQYQQPQQPYQQPQQQAAPAGSDVGKVVGDAFKSTPNAAKGLLNDPMGVHVNLPTALVFLGSGLVLYVLSCLMILGGLLGPAKDALKYIGVSVTGTSIWLGFLVWLISTLVPFLIVLLMQVVKKEQVNWQKALITGASVNVCPAIIAFVAGIFALISATIGGIFIALAVVTAAVLNAKLLFAGMKKKDNLVTILVVSLVLAVVLLLSYLVIYKVLESMLVSAMGGLIGGLGNSLSGLFS